MSELAGKAAIVTGASRGIGAATAKELAKHGVSVVVAARTHTDVERIANEINEDGGKAIACTCDVSRYDDVRQMVEIPIPNTGRASSTSTTRVFIMACAPPSRSWKNRARALSSTSVQALPPERWKAGAIIAQPRRRYYR